MTQLMFTCHGCGLQRCIVEVRERRGDENVVTWMEAVKLAVSARHRRLSPACRQTTFDLAIPLSEESGRVGEKAAPIDPAKLRPDFLKSKGAN